MTTDLFRFGSDATDAGTDIDFRLEPNPTAPAGVGGECLFRNIWIVITYNSVFDLTLTPILDGQLLTNEAVSWTVTATRDEPVTEKFEIGLARSHPHYAAPASRYGQRGGWFSFRLEGTDVGLVCGVVELEGAEIEYEVLREGLPHYREFASDMLIDSRRFPDVRFMFGGEPALYEFGRGEDDAGVAIDLLAQPNKLAPAGIGGETMFTRLFFVVTHDNPQTYNFDLIPILDNTEMPTLTVAIPGVRSPVVGRVIEVGLSRTYAAVQKYGVRGTWFTFRLQGNGTVPNGDIIVEGVDLEYEMLREADQAINVAPALVTTPLELTQTVGFNAILQAQAAALSAGFDAILAVGSYTGTLSLDAIITQQNALKTAALDAAIKQRRVTVGLGMDAELAKILSESASFDAVLEALDVTETAELDAILSPSGTPWTATEIATLDAILKALNDTTTASLDSVLVVAGQSVGASLNAILQAVVTASLGLDAFLLDTADHPNEPSGMTPATERPFNVQLEDGWI